jgi:hypothetical protein
MLHVYSHVYVSVKQVKRRQKRKYLRPCVTLYTRVQIVCTHNSGRNFVDKMNHFCEWNKFLLIFLMMKQITYGRGINE